LGGAGWEQVSAPLHIDHANAAGADLVDHFDVMQIQVAEGGDVYAKAFGGFKDRGAFWHLRLHVVYR
jgi:hypothetical protein